MINRMLRDAIRQAAETIDFSALLDRLAKDVELRVTVDTARSVHSVRRGRQSVIDQLLRRDAACSAAYESPPEVFAEGERFVACHDESLPIGNGVTIRSERTIVFDVRHGIIARIGIYYDLTPSAEARASVNAGSLDVEAALAR
jgi:ketosteroid isomerase-like protein